jgi:dCTP deaminase
MILSGATIKYFVGDNIEDWHGPKIGVDPKPDPEQYQPASLDVRLGDELYHFDDDKRVTAPQHKLQPEERYLGHTKEKISLPNDHAAQLAGRSTMGRQGIIVHKTAGWVDPGFEGQITLELMNLGNDPVVIESGKRVAQLVFFQLDHPSQGYDGSYQGQEKPTKAQ